MNKSIPYWHTTTLGRLGSILKVGLLSFNCSQKIGIKGYRRNFKSSWNGDFVSVMANTSSRKVTAPHVALLIDPSMKTTSTNYKEEDTNRPSPNELLVKDMIAPESFLGVTIGEVGWSFRLEKPIKPKHASFKKVIELVKESKTGLSIYFKGKQIWPQ